jgi:hypothetical protein
VSYYEYRRLTPASARLWKSRNFSLSLASTWRGDDYRYGGGSCRHAIVSYLNSSTVLLATPATEPVRIALRVALADLHNLARADRLLDVAVLGQAPTRAAVLDLPASLCHLTSVVVGLGSFPSRHDASAVR